MERLCRWPELLPEVILSAELGFPHVYGETTWGVLSHQTQCVSGQSLPGAQDVSGTGPVSVGRPKHASLRQMLPITGCRITGSLSNFLGICSFWTFVRKWRLLSPPSRKYCNHFVWNQILREKVALRMPRSIKKMKTGRHFIILIELLLQKVVSF